MLFAVLEDDISEVKRLLEQGADVNAKDDFGHTPLSNASLVGLTEIVKLLLAKGADVNAKDDFGHTPLREASDNGHYEVVKLLLANGANDYNGGLIGSAGFGNIEFVNLFLSKGADVNAKDNNGITPLYKASSMGHYEVVKLLLANGANDYNGGLIGSAYFGDIEFVNLFLSKGADVNAKDNNGITPLYKASSMGHYEVVKLLLSKGADVNAKDNNGWTPLRVASSRGHTEIVKLLIAKRADVNAKDNNGNTPLSEASMWGHTEVVKLLIAKRADVNAKDNNGDTPLSSASYEGHTEIVKLLLAKGADVHAKDEYGNTPLSEASLRGNTEIVKLLLAKGANKADLIEYLLAEWGFCNNDENCINNMRITFENKSYSRITQITFMLTIKSQNESVLYKKKHTVACKLDHEEVAPCDEFYLSNPVYVYTDGSGDGDKVKIDVEVLTVR